jgi:hypothetical protein
LTVSTGEGDGEADRDGDGESVPDGEGEDAGEAPPPHAATARRTTRPAIPSRALRIDVLRPVATWS